MKERNFRENRKKIQQIWSSYERAIPHTSFNPGSKEERRTIHVLFIWIHLVIHYPYVCLLFPYEYSWTDKENTNFPVCSQISLCVFTKLTKNMNFPVCSWIFLWMFTQPTKKIFISMFVHNFLWEFSHNRQARVNFPVCLIISCESFGNRQGNVNFPVSCWKNTQGNSAHTEKK